MSNRPIQEEQRHKRRDRRREVSFHPKTRVLAIPTVEELSVREIQSLWPTPEESKKNQGELVTCVRMARKNPRDASICTRGIEKLLDPASVARLRKCRENLIDAVIDNQEAQWQRGLYHADPEEIRSIASRISQRSVEEAITLAAKDEAYVRTMRRREQVGRVGRVVAAPPLPLLPLLLQHHQSEEGPSRPTTLVTKLQSWNGPSRRNPAHVAEQSNAKLERNGRKSPPNNFEHICL